MSPDQSATASIPMALPAGMERETLLGLEPGRRRQAMMGWLVELCREVDPGAPASLDPADPVSLESLVAAALKASVEARLHVELPLLDLIQGVSLGQLADLLLDELERGGEEVPGLAFQVA